MRQPGPERSAVKTVIPSSDISHQRAVRRGRRVEAAVAVASAVVTVVVAMWWTWSTLAADPIDRTAAAVIPLFWFVAALATIGSVVSVAVLAATARTDARAEERR